MAVAKARNVGARRACQASSGKRRASSGKHRGSWLGSSRAIVEATRAFGAGVDGVDGANARAVSVSNTSCSARRRLWGHGHPERLFGAKIWVRNGQDPSAAMRRTPPEWLAADVGEGTVGAVGAVGAEGVQGLRSWSRGDGAAIRRREAPMQMVGEHVARPDEPGEPGEPDVL
jgi:hypothetical protein